VSYSSTILADSPVAYWRLGEASGTTADNAEGTTAYDGTYVNTPTLGVTGALTNDSDTAVTFDRTVPESVTSGSSITFNSSGWSVECWVKTAWDQQSIFWYIGGAADCYPSINGPAWGRIRIYGYNGVVACTSAPEGDIAANTWAHVVVTKDASDIYSVYINGVDRTVYVASPAWTSGTYAFSFPRPDYQPYSGSLDEVAVYQSVLSSGQIAAHYAAGIAALPAWTTPADTVSMSTTPELQFDSPASAVAQHFQLQLDTANTFDTGNLRTYDSSVTQTNWAYWDGDSWEALPGTGLPSGMSGNEVRYTVTSALSSATWYRRVRAGTGT
jgi:hypothetical protein